MQRCLWNVILSPAFLNKVVASNAHAVATDLAHLWFEKAREVEGLPFDVHGDIQMAMLESSWKNLFGSDLNLLDCRRKVLKKHRIVNKHCPVAVFKEGQLPEICHIFRMLFSCLDWVVQGVSPQAYAWLFRSTGILGRLERRKNRILDTAIHAAHPKPTHGSAIDERDLTNAISLVLDKAAKKGENRGITHESLRDEALELLLTGGQSTTSALLSWALKYLMDHVDVQAKLRAELDSVFDDGDTGVQPSVDTIVARSIPYLDAVIAETLRLSATGPVCFRQVVAPCTILGHLLPTGTPLILVTGDASHRPSAMPILSNELRSKTSRKIPVPICDRKMNLTSNIFDPDRWLVDEKYEPNAFPMLPFSAGPRGCFGKSIAMLEMRIFLVVLMTHFELPRLAEQLSTHRAVDGLSRKPRDCYINPKSILRQKKMD